MNEEEDSFEKAIALFKSSNFLSFNIDDYQFVKDIGRGRFGCARLYTDKKTMKEVIIKNLFSDSFTTKSIREIEIMSKMQHPCLCNLIASNIVEDGKDGVDVNLLLPYMVSGSLEKLLKSEGLKKKWNTTSKMKAIYGIAAGMDYMHSIKAIHRDLKSENILLDENFEIKISDFGLSRFVNDQTTALTVSIGTPFYMSPEMINDDIYDEKVDVYSYSIILYEILYTNSFPKTNPYAWYTKVLKGERLPIDESQFQYGKGLFKLINSCWSSTPSDRPSFSQILKIIPTILPPGTNVPVFKEYARRVNPNFENKKRMSRYRTFAPVNKAPLFDEKVRKTQKKDHQAKKEEMKQKIIEENDEDTPQKIVEENDIEPQEIIKDDDKNLVLNEEEIKDLNIGLDGNLNISQNIEEDEEETENEEQIDPEFMNIQSLPAKSQSCNFAEKEKINIYDISLQEAKNGNPKSLFDYGILLYTGANSTKKDIPRAIEVIQEAAEYNSVDAYYFLGMHYLDGTEGFEPNLKKARHYISLAADNGRPLALFYMGFYDQKGLEIYPPGIDPNTTTDSEKYIWPVNKKDGFKYAIKAAEKGHAMSAIMVARSYETGISPSSDSDFSLKKDEAMATKYYKMAADSGDISSMVKFSHRAEEGIGMKKNPSLAVKYLKNASNRENMHAMFNLGKLYFKGLYGLKKNQKKGAELIKKAADKGLPDAQVKIAKILKKGADGVPKNKEESIRYEKMGKKINK